MRSLLLVLSCLLFRAAVAQEPDTTVLGEVEVNPLPTLRPQLKDPASISVISREQMELHPGQTLVPLMNTVPGVRMEERSPGSYRLGIRGSLLRSPFGVRNVKVYIDEYPFTDAGGNTYFNSIDPNCTAGIKVLKGPMASLYGANTGGVILLSSYNANDTSMVNAALGGGSFGMFRENVTVQKRMGKYLVNFSQGFQSSSGYRANSAMQRSYVHTAQQWAYSNRSSLRLLALYSDLDYQTPGGLTYEQWQSDPRQARPRKGITPGAEEQKAGVRNKTLFAGLLHETKLLPRLRSLVAVTGMHTDFENPFITNYEERNEITPGFRTLLEITERKNAKAKWRWTIGAEEQSTRSDISNFDNAAGLKGTKQSAAVVKAKQTSAFFQVRMNINDKWSFEGDASYNDYRYQYRNKAPVTETAYTTVEFDLQIMPRLAASWSITKNLAWRVSTSRGYSPPSIAEIRPSSNIIDTLLQAEHGWNYETGFRFRTLHERLWVDAVFFYFSLDDAIVRRINDQDEEYFVNAGGTKQPGFESQLYLWIVRPQETGIFRSVQLTHSFTYHDFSFVNYLVGTDDHSGNDVTGVAKQVSVTGIELRMKRGFFFFAQHNYTSRIPLNDANTVYAPAYNLVQVKGGWRPGKKERQNFQLFAGADNLLDEEYSLGNDLNAFGGRYYNPAPGRNYYAGVKVTF